MCLYLKNKQSEHHFRVNIIQKNFSMITRILKFSRNLLRPKYKFNRAYCQNVPENGSIENAVRYESRLIAVLNNADWNSFKYGEISLKKSLDSI